MHYDDEVLSRYVDGELTSRERAEVEEHLVGCGQCREAEAELEFLRAAAATADRLEPPARVWHRIQERISADSGRRARLRWVWAGVPALAAAVVVAVLVAGRQPENSRPAVLGPASERTAVDSGIRRQEKMPAGSLVRSPAVVAGAKPKGAKSAGPKMVEKVTAEEVGAESDRAVLAAAAEYRRYLEGLDQAIVESEQAMRQNPGHPRVRLVHTQARAGAAMAVEQLIPEGD